MNKAVMNYDKLYFDYLTNIIDVNDKAANYSKLLEAFYYFDFLWLPNIPLDENRAKDGLQLRTMYKAFLPEEEHVAFDSIFVGRQCSILEMFVAFADRLTYIVSSFDCPSYFWLFVENLGLNSYDNLHYDQGAVFTILDAFLYGKKLNPEDQNPPVLFPCRKVYENLDRDLYMQANYYLNYLR